MSSLTAPDADPVELGRRQTLAQLRRCVYGQHRIGVIGALGMREAAVYGAQLQEEARRNGVARQGDSGSNPATAY